MSVVCLEETEGGISLRDLPFDIWTNILDVLEGEPDGVCGIVALYNLRVIKPAEILEYFTRKYGTRGTRVSDLRRVWADLNMSGASRLRKQQLLDGIQNFQKSSDYAWLLKLFPSCMYRRACNALQNFKSIKRRRWEEDREEEIRQQRRERSIKRRRREEKIRQQRREQLQIAFQPRGLEIRDDSRLCRKYIDSGEGSVDHIAKIMDEMRFYHSETEYATILGAAYNQHERERRYEKSYFDPIAESACAKDLALKRWKEKHKDCLQEKKSEWIFPPHLTSHPYLAN